MKLKAPFVYFGGKSSVADIVWRRFGNPRMYVEPFCGSAAMLLARPGCDFKNEIVNDYDGHIANVWRALQADPDAVAKWCDWPCNHIDLMARREVLNGGYDTLRESLIADDEFYDAKMAGYYIWCSSNWIGSGLTRKKSIPNLTCDLGIMTARKCQIPNLTCDQGIMQARKQNHQIDNNDVYVWLRNIQRRLHGVKVVCGDWMQVLGGNWRTSIGDCAVFLDPPYSSEANRTNNIYKHEDLSVAHRVREWCKANGDNQDYKIALCGYDGEHNELDSIGWECYQWKANGGFSNIGKKEKNTNNKKERIWFSPFCTREQELLFNE